MTGLAQSATDSDIPEVREVSKYAEPAQQSQPDRRRPRWFGAIGIWRGISWLVAGCVGCLAIAWFVLFGPGQTGSKAEWFFGAVVFCVVMVSMWQITSIQRRASQDAAMAADRLRRELAAAEERSARELALMQTLHRTEIEAQQGLHRAEVDAQRELARVERIHLRNQLQKQAMIEVSRAVNEHTQMLATLWNQGAIILRIEDRAERELAMAPIFERIGQVVNDFSVELSNAHLLVEDDRLHDALNGVSEAALMAIRVAEDLHVAVVDGRAPEPGAIAPVQRLMHARAAEARRLAWDLLRNGLESYQTRTQSTSMSAG
jgi:hypothetical protein